MASAALSDGFRLIGFETWPDPDVAQMEQLLSEVHQQRQKAFVVLERHLFESRSGILEQLRNEGGRVVITQIPPLHDVSNFHSNLDRQVQALLGDSIALEE